MGPRDDLDDIGVMTLNSETDDAVRGRWQLATGGRTTGPVPPVQPGPWQGAPPTTTTGPRPGAAVAIAVMRPVPPPDDPPTEPLVRPRSPGRQPVREPEPSHGVEQLTGTVAHDVNNLLTLIRNYANFVADALDAAVAADQASGGPSDCGPGPATGTTVIETAGLESMRRDIEQIQRAGERAADLTAQLLLAARQPRSAVGAIDINTVVRDTVQMLRRPLGDAIDLQVELDDALWPVAVDPARLEQALVNLAMNARDAMPTGGRLTVMTGNVLLAESGDGAVDPNTQKISRDGLRARRAGVSGPNPAVDPGHGESRPARDRPRRFVGLWVSDTGTGMTPSIKARVFEPFFTTKPADGGTGLGMSVVRDVVTQAGGDARISSTLGAGTTVSLLFPAVEPTPLASERQPAPVPTHTPGGGIAVTGHHDARPDRESRTGTQQAPRATQAGARPQHDPAYPQGSVHAPSDGPDSPPPRPMGAGARPGPESGPRAGAAGRAPYGQPPSAGFRGYGQP